MTSALSVPVSPAQIAAIAQIDYAIGVVRSSAEQVIAAQRHDLETILRTILAAEGVNTGTFDRIENGRLYYTVSEAAE